MRDHPMDRDPDLVTCAGGPCPQCGTEASQLYAVRERYGREGHATARCVDCVFDDARALRDQHWNWRDAYHELKQHAEYLAAERQLDVLPRAELLTLLRRERARLNWLSMDGSRSYAGYDVVEVADGMGPVTTACQRTNIRQAVDAMFAHHYGSVERGVEAMLSWGHVQGYERLDEPRPHHGFPDYPEWFGPGPVGTPLVGEPLDDTQWVKPEWVATDAAGRVDREWRAKAQQAVDTIESAELREILFGDDPEAWVRPRRKRRPKPEVVAAKLAAQDAQYAEAAADPAFVAETAETTKAFESTMGDGLATEDDGRTGAWVLTGIPEWETEDAGKALIGTLYPGRQGVYGGDDDDENGIFVRLQSWDENKLHPEFSSVQGKRVRVTIEVLDR